MGTGTENGIGIETGSEIGSGIGIGIGTDSGRREMAGTGIG